jgi:hypothetical protein
MWNSFRPGTFPSLPPAQPQRPTGALLSPGRSVQVKGLWRDFRACDVFVTQSPRRSVRYGCDLRKRTGSRRSPEGQAFDLAARETGLTVTVLARELALAPTRVRELLGMHDSRPVLRLV